MRFCNTVLYLAVAWCLLPHQWAVGECPVQLFEESGCGAQFGLSVAGAGDVNGDGYDDLIVGAPFDDVGSLEQAGVVHVYLGPLEAGFASHWRAVGNQRAMRFGFAVASAGDVNGDGFADVVIGAPGADLICCDYPWCEHDCADTGAVFLYFGSPFGLREVPSPDNADWSYHGNLWLGRAVAGAGDVNGDGFADIIVGAPYESHHGPAGEGRALVFYGSMSGPSPYPDWVTRGGQFAARYGASVAHAGDVNGDGFADVLVGAPTYDHRQVDAGRAVLYFGSRYGLNTSPAWSVRGNQAGAQLGTSVASAGDVNGDGFSDVIIGAPRRDDAHADEGAAYVYHGSPSGLDTAPAFTAHGGQAHARFAHSVASAGDVNGDTYSDIVVGAPLGEVSGPADTGIVFVWHGGPSGVGTVGNWSNVDWLGVGERSGFSYGRSVGCAGDVNGDGFSDLLIGVPSYFGHNCTGVGRVYCLPGSRDGIVCPRWTVGHYGAEANDGVPILAPPPGAGDINGDARVNGRDIQVLASVLRDPRRASAAEARAADINLDGDIDSADAEDLISILLSH